MGTNRKTLSVLVATDHAAFRQALAVVLGTRPDLRVDAQAGSLAEARGLLRSGGLRGIDAAVVDLALPDGEGVELVAELVEAEPGVAVLALFDRLDLERRGLALRAGAFEALGKGSGMGELLAAIGRLGGR